MQSREAITKALAEKEGVVHEAAVRGDIDTALAAFSQVITAYREARMDWSYALSQCTPLLAPLGASGIDAVVARIEQLDREASAFTATKAVGIFGKVKDPLEHVVYEAVAARIALGRIVAEVVKAGGSFGEPLDRLFLPDPKVFRAAAQDDFVIRYFGALKHAADAFKALPDDRALAFVAAWRKFHPTKGLELYIKGLFSGRPAIWKSRGASSPVERVRDLAKASGLPCTMPIYALAKAADKTSLNRIGGRVKGLAADRMPPGMQLVLTIDLEQVPELGALVPGARALTLWVDEPRGGFDDAAVVPLTEDECARGMEGGKTFRMERLLVPPEVFDWSEGRTQEIRKWLAALDARALGRPFFLQQSPFPGDEVGFVLQANEAFTGLNLGDSGRLFWYLDHAFWESA